MIMLRDYFYEKRLTIKESQQKVEKQKCFKYSGSDFITAISTLKIAWQTEHQKNGALTRRYNQEKVIMLFCIVARFVQDDK